MLRIDDLPVGDLQIVANHSALTLAQFMIVHAPKKPDLFSSFKKWLTENEVRALGQVCHKLEGELNPIEREVMLEKQLSPFFNEVAFDIGVNRLREISGVNVAKVAGTFTEFKAALDEQFNA